ncbi:transcriptional regulator, partial [Staphylococcus aureus]
MSEQYSKINTDTLERVTEIFKAIGDYNRILIMEVVSVSEANDAHLSHPFNLSQ